MGGQTYLYDSTSYAGWAPFIPFENVGECTTSYAATVQAYFFTYLASDIESVRDPIGSIDSIEDALMVMAFYAAWGLFYIHQTYPNYAMCVSEGTLRRLRIHGRPGPAVRERRLRHPGAGRLQHRRLRRRHQLVHGRRRAAAGEHG